MSEQLLKDPIHFLFEDTLSAYDPNLLTKFSAEEKALLGRYLREGGFLFIDGTNLYLREMKDQLREILGSEARLAPIPTSHPIYHSFYEFGGGFPGENRSPSRYAWRATALGIIQSTIEMISWPYSKNKHPLYPGPNPSRKPGRCIRQRGCGASSWMASWSPC